MARPRKHTRVYDCHTLHYPLFLHIVCAWQTPPSSPNPPPLAHTRHPGCGGQGYLSVNRFGQLIGFAHAGVTAEGDNRVLFQKVAKELSTAARAAPAVQARMRATPPSIRSAAALLDLPTLQALFTAREGRLLTQLTRRMAGLRGGDEVYDVWMKAESDLVQATATAYAEREVLDACARAIASAPRSLATVLTQLTLLYALRRVEVDIAQVLSEGLLPVEAARWVPDHVRVLCRELGGGSLQLVEAFGIPDALVSAPIASDWVKYNAVDNRGELFGSQF